MEKTNKSYTLTLRVNYALITTDSDSANAIDLANDDIGATQWFHKEGYKAHIEGNVLVIAKDFGWSRVESRYVIIPDIDYHGYKENRNYTAIIAAAKRFAMEHTLVIIHKINSGR